MDPMALPVEPPPSARPPGWFERLSALAEVMLVAFLGSFFALSIFAILGTSPMTDASHIVAFMWLEALVTVVLIGGLLRIHRPAVRLGWSRQGGAREAALGLGALPLLFLVTIGVGAAFQWLCPPCVTEQNPLLNIVRTGADLALFLVSSLFVGGFKEELQRAFVLTRFRSHLGGVWVGLTVWTVVFGALHSLQGFDKAVAAGALGLVFGLVYIWRGKLLAPMVAHSLYDVVTLIIFWWTIHTPGRL